MGPLDSATAVRSKPPQVQRAAVVTWLHERRGAPRQRMIRAAWLIGPGPDLACVLLDLSAGGARLWLPDPDAVPDLMVLRIAGVPDRAARRRWQRGQEMGVAFLPG